MCPLWHSSDFAGKTADVQNLLQDKHLGAALQLPGRPWDGKEIPDYARKVECIYDTDKAAHILRKMIEKGGRVAFDYETNMLNANCQGADCVLFRELGRTKDNRLSVAGRGGKGYIRAAPVPAA